MAIISCPGCKPHQFQDKKYGNQRRVANPTKVAKGETQKFRCTICETVRGK